MGIFSSRLCALSPGGAPTDAGDLGRDLRQHGYHRKYAIRLLNGSLPPERAPSPVRRPWSPRYSPAAIAVLGRLWEAAGCPWSVRLKALVPLWKPWLQKRFRLSAAVERQLEALSARQIDRRLRARKHRLKRRLYGRTRPCALPKHQIPAKNDAWDVRVPGFTKVDLASLSDNTASGEFAYSLNVPDIHATWTETRAVLAKGEIAVRDRLEEIAAALPFRLLALDSDNVKGGTDPYESYIPQWLNRSRIEPQVDGT